jgi:hypothetical protein
LWVVLALSIVHAAAGGIGVLRLRWQAKALSAAAGISIAYVFLDLIPGLADAQDVIESVGMLPGLEIHVFAVALVGLTVAFWVETAARKSHRDRRSVGTTDETGEGPFRLAVASFIVYNSAIGYSVARPGDEAIASLWLYALAMGLHFIVNDHALAEHHGSRYRKWGRWLLIAALWAGWIVGIVPALRIPPEMLALVLAYVAGGVILNVLRHELPDTDRTADVVAFAAGSAVFGALLVLSSTG